MSAAVGAATRWLFHSPGRLLAGVVATGLAVAGAGAVAVVGSDVAGREPTPGAGSSSVVPAAAVPARSTGVPAAEPAAGEAPGAAEFRRVATAFVQTWLTAPDEAPSEWQARIDGLATPQLAAGLARMDTAQVPAATLSGPLRTVAAGEYGASYAARLTDGSGVLIEVVDDVGGPRVSDIAPDDS